MEKIIPQLKALKEITPDRGYANRSRAFVLSARQLPQPQSIASFWPNALMRVAAVGGFLMIIGMVGLYGFLGSSGGSVASLNEETLNTELASLAIDMHLEAPEYAQRHAEVSVASIEANEEQINALLDEITL